MCAPGWPASLRVSSSRRVPVPQRDSSPSGHELPLETAHQLRHQLGKLALRTVQSDLGKHPLIRKAVAEQSDLQVLGILVVNLVEAILPGERGIFTADLVAP